MRAPAGWGTWPAAPLAAGLLAAGLGLGCPVVRSAANNRAWKSLSADMRQVALAVEAYAAEHRVYPGPAGGTVGGLEDLLVPAYADELPPVDPWGQPLAYAVSADGGHFLLASPGCDGVFEDEVGGPFLRRGCEPAVVWVDGMFVQWPEGYQCECTERQRQELVARDRAVARDQWLDDANAEVRALYQGLQPR